MWPTYRDLKIVSSTIVDAKYLGGALVTLLAI
jgi:hypothetical protein